VISGKVIAGGNDVIALSRKYLLIDHWHERNQR